MSFENLRKNARQVLERVRFPSHGDGYSLYRNIAGPAIYFNAGIVALDLALLAGSYSGLISNEAHEIAQQTINPVSRIGYGIFAGSAPLIHSVLAERQNRVCFGDSLTVSKVATLPNSDIAKAVPELQQEPYYGELHFMGKKFVFQVIQRPDFLQVMREGISGLQELVSACEEDDPRINGINYFIGKSPIVTNRLARLGFDVTTPPAKKKYLVKDPVDFFRQIGPQPLGWLAHREPLMCIASRDSLIANKATIDRFAARISKS